MATSPRAEPVWRALTSARALSPIGLAIWLSLGGLRYISRALATTGDDLLSLVAFQGCTIVAAVIAALIVRKALCRNDSYRSSIGRTFLCYLAVLLFVAVVQRLAVDVIGITNGPSFTRVASALVLMYLVAGLLDYFESYREAIRALRREQQALVQLRTRFATKLQGLRSQVEAATWARIRAAWQIVIGQLQTQQGEVAAAELRSLAEYIRSELIEPIRNFSYQVEKLKIDDEGAEQFSAAKVDTSLDWRQVLRTTTPVIGPYYPFAVGITFFVFAMVNFEDAATPWMTALACLAMSIVASLVLAAARRWLLPPVRHFESNVAKWLVFLTILITLNVVIVVGFTDFLSLQGVSSPGILTAPLSSMVIVLWAAFSSLAAKVAETQTRLQQVIALTRQETLALEQEMAATRLQLAHILHGEVQTKLTAAALRLDVGVELIPKGQDKLPEPISRTTIEQAQTVLQSAADCIDAIASAPASKHPQNQGVIDQIEELRRAWAGIIEVTVTIPEHTARMIDTRVNDASLTAVVSDIVREAILNAVRHAEAKQALVTIEEVGRTCRITVENDGHAPSVQRSPGLGQTMLTRTTSNWTLTPRPSGGGTLQVELPLLVLADETPSIV